MGAALTGDVAGLTSELGHAKKGEHPAHSCHHLAISGTTQQIARPSLHQEMLSRLCKTVCSGFSRSAKYSVWLQPVCIECFPASSAYSRGSATVNMSPHLERTTSSLSTGPVALSDGSSLLKLQRSDAKDLSPTSVTLCPVPLLCPALSQRHCAAFRIPI